jgi:tetratricopeptide (TPR) repeat protein
MFLKALQCEATVKPKAMMNLGLLYNTRGNLLAQTGEFSNAKAAAIQAEKYIEGAKPLLESMASSLRDDPDVSTYLGQYRPLRLVTHRLIGQLYANEGAMDLCEAEFRRAIENFPEDIGAWQMLGRVLEIQGKKEEMQQVIEKVVSLRETPNKYP